MANKLEYRMYGFVPYNISEIQKGIQFGHAVQEYNNKFFNGHNAIEISRFNKWRLDWKTFIILNGGTTNSNKDSVHYGSLNKILDDLNENEIELATFCEPDLGDQLSAICFIVDERVFNFEDYPTFKDYLIDVHGERAIRERKKNFSGMSLEGIYVDTYKEWVDLIGGEKNVFLKGFLKNFKLA
jgi:hypothetical protein